MEPLEVHDEGVLDGLELCGDDRQHGHVDTVELVEASPGTTLAQTRVDLSHGLETTITYRSIWVDIQ